MATLLARLEGILGPIPEWMLHRGRYAHRFYTRSGMLYERASSNQRYELLLPKRTTLRHRYGVWGLLWGRGQGWWALQRTGYVAARAWCAPSRGFHGVGDGAGRLRGPYAAAQVRCATKGARRKGPGWWALGLGELLQGRAARTDPCAGARMPATTVCVSHLHTTRCVVHSGGTDKGRDCRPPAPQCPEKALPKWLHPTPLFHSPVTYSAYTILLARPVCHPPRMPDADEGLMEFVSYLLTVDPRKRPTAAEALKHPWLQMEYPSLDA